VWEISRHGRDLLDQLVTRAHRQDTLRPDATALDIVWLIETYGRRGPAAPGTEGRAIRQQLLTFTHDGLRDCETEPLPGPPAGAQHYKQRWKPAIGNLRRVARSIPGRVSALPT
jgi:hypothetical protein